jgi:hypothetical protein
MVYRCDRPVTFIREFIILMITLFKLAMQSDKDKIENKASKVLDSNYSRRISEIDQDSI